MKKGGGRAKGNGFERQVAKLIVETFCKFGIKDKHCYRTPGSGGHKYASKTDPGDLVIHRKLRKFFRYSVECKSYREISLFDLFVPFKNHKKSSQFKNWLAQTCRSAKGSRLQPLLVFKHNRSEVLCALPEKTGIGYWSEITNVYLKFRYNHENWYVLKFSKLLSYLRQEQEKM